MDLLLENPYQVIQPQLVETIIEVIKIVVLVVKTMILSTTIISLCYSIHTVPIMSIKHRKQTK